jgi:hypothetical protein
MNDYTNNKAVLYTDEYSIYQGIGKHSKFKEYHTVNHSQKEYDKGKFFVNNCGNKHSFLRPFIRIFRGVSKKFLDGYVMIL